MESLRKEKLRSLKEELGEFFDYINIHDDDSFIKICDLYLHDIMFEPTNGIENRYLGLYYAHFEEKYDIAKKYYETATNYKDHDSIYYLANYFRRNNNDTEAKKYFLMAIEHGNIKAMYGFGRFNFYRKNYKEAKKYFLMAIEYNCIKSMDGFAELLLLQKIQKSQKILFTGDRTWLY